MPTGTITVRVGLFLHGEIVNMVFFTEEKSLLKVCHRAEILVERHSLKCVGNKGLRC